MPSYVYLQHYTSQGDLGISRDVFVTLGQHVVSYIREKNDKGFKISDNVDVTIRSNRVIYKFYVMKKLNYQNLNSYIMIHKCGHKSPIFINLTKCV